MNKVVTLDQAMGQIHDGMSIMVGGFCGVGSPLKCIERLVQTGVKELTLISVTNANPFAKGKFDIAALFVNRQVKRFITSHNGTCPEAVELASRGELDVEFYPMGTWIEKIRAGGAGLGGFLTPTGVDTLVEQGKQKMRVDGRDYLLELPLRADLALIKGYRGDPMGNVEYRGVSINSNMMLATAADYVVAEVNEIVGVGEIEPQRVGTPGIFVKAVVQGDSLDAHQEKYRALWAGGGILKA
ncbi:MAG: 3-oxoacid CoA-transferase subunit A [Sporomusaceae bacterium]|nr:3-oxoacid CoA-transferase subunit A [Sporomusaceae bacterium]